MAPTLPTKTKYVATSDVTPTVTAKRYSKKEIASMAHCICGEAEGESLLGQIAVGNVIMNRASSWGMSITQVIYQRGQFDGMKSKRKVTDKCRRAAMQVLYYDVMAVPENVLFFANESISTDSKWIKYIRQFHYKTIGNHQFYEQPGKRTRKS